MSIELMKNNCEDQMEMMLTQMDKLPDSSMELPTTDFAAATPSFGWEAASPMREMIFRIAAMQPVHIDPESVRPPRRRNVRISKDPQSVAARLRRERISERMRILQRLVPGGTKMDTASMLDEAVHYVKFLKNQVRSLQGMGFPMSVAGASCFPPLLADRHM